MKKRILSIAIAICSTVCSYAQEHLKIDASKSELKWSSDYTFYFGGHYGTVQFKEGYFIKTDNKITGGSFVIDMNTIANVDGGYNEGLVLHLKDHDFFDVKKFPTAKLVITEVDYKDEANMIINADLTIKGITLPIKYKAKANYENMEMTTKFKIDRMRWGIDFNHKLKSEAISDAIVFEVKLNL